MKQIVYTGTSDVRVLTNEDFQNLDVHDQAAVAFRRGEPVEFKNETAKVFLEHPSLAGEFAEVEAPEPAADSKASKSRASGDASSKSTDQS